MQEIYNDIVEQKGHASLIMKKMLAFMKEADDMSMIGPVIKEQQKILNECTEKKISLVKLQNAMMKQVGNDGGNKAKFEKDNKHLGSISNQSKITFQKTTPTYKNKRSLSGYTRQI